MENPIISCDVSKGSSHIQGFIGLSNPVGSPFVVRHLKCDLKLIKDLAKDLEKQTRKNQYSCLNIQVFTMSALLIMRKASD